MKHKHYNCIVAWAEGKKIQYRGGYSSWIDCVDTPSWRDDWDYRIKPSNPIIMYIKIDPAANVSPAAVIGSGIGLRFLSCENVNLKLVFQDNRIIEAEILNNGEC